MCLKRWVSKMAKKIDPRDFYLNTDYEMDKIIYYKEAKLTPGQYGNVTLPHSLGIAPLVTGVWSKTADFTEPHSFSGISGVVDPSTNSYSVDIITCSANQSEFFFTQYAGPISSPTNFPFYARIICFEPAGGHKDLPKTSQNANQFILNTDYNYLKLFKSGSEDVVWNTQTGLYDPITITHNLGYHAQGLFWVESVDTYYNDIMPINGVLLPSMYVDKAGVESYTDKFIVYPPPLQAGSGRIHYRIYYDEA